MALTKSDRDNLDYTIPLSNVIALDPTTVQINSKSEDQCVTTQTARSEKLPKKSVPPQKNERIEFYMTILAAFASNTELLHVVAYIPDENVKAGEIVKIEGLQGLHREPSQTGSIWIVPKGVNKPRVYQEYFKDHVLPYLEKMDKHNSDHPRFESDSCKELDHNKVVILDGERGFIENIFVSHKEDLQKQHCQLLKIPRSTSSTSNAADAGNIHKDIKKAEKDRHWIHSHNPDLNAINTKSITTQIANQLSKYVGSGVHTRGKTEKRSQNCAIQAMQYLSYALPLAYSHKNMIQSWHKTGIVDKTSRQLNVLSILLNCTKKHPQEILDKCLEAVDAISEHIRDGNPSVPEQMLEGLPNTVDGETLAKTLARVQENEKDFIHMRACLAHDDTLDTYSKKQAAKKARTDALKAQEQQRADAIKAKRQKRARAQKFQKIKQRCHEPRSEQQRMLRVPWSGGLLE
mmetsp:Transcript_24480/g.48157  ORF Transcript_24480/g.48157 Transcript_24480/m.48157 type:complete len:461 (-) Transcript_24480:215-1597(-)